MSHIRWSYIDTFVLLIPYPENLEAMVIHLYIQPFVTQLLSSEAAKLKGRSIELDKQVV